VDDEWHPTTNIKNGKTWIRDWHTHLGPWCSTGYGNPWRGESARRRVGVGHGAETADALLTLRDTDMERGILWLFEDLGGQIVAMEAVERLGSEPLCLCPDGAVECRQGWHCHLGGGWRSRRDRIPLRLRQSTMKRRGGWVARVGGACESPAYSHWQVKSGRSGVGVEIWNSGIITM
jgi:hypothetical protein